MNTPKIITKSKHTHMHQFSFTQQWRQVYGKLLAFTKKQCTLFWA